VTAMDGGNARIAGANTRLPAASLPKRTTPTPNSLECCPEIYLSELRPGLRFASSGLRLNGGLGRVDRDIRWFYAALYHPHLSRLLPLDAFNRLDAVFQIRAEFCLHALAEALGDCRRPARLGHDEDIDLIRIDLHCLELGNGVGLGFEILHHIDQGFGMDGGAVSQADQIVGAAVDVIQHRQTPATGTVGA